MAAAKHSDISANWPSSESQVITFASKSGPQTGVVKEIRWGLVWRDFILEDGRVVPEHKIVGHPDPPAWRKPEDISQSEREEWERRLVSMADAGLDPRKDEQPFRAELNQYLAYTYLRYKPSKPKPEENRFPERITEAKHAVMDRLAQLMEFGRYTQESDSTAYSLATLKKLEITLKQK